MLLWMLALTGCNPAAVGTASSGAIVDPGHPNQAILKIDPASISVRTGETTTFRSTFGGSVVTAQWSASAGSITSDGVFTAPAQTGPVQVHATYKGTETTAVANVVGPGTPGDLYVSASSSCASMQLRTTGTTYYFCDCQTGAQTGCVPGNDANTGTSSAAPKQTWTAAVSRFGSINGGDTIALCQGGAWAIAAAGTCGGMLATNTRCSAGSNLADPANTTTCDIRDYVPTTFNGKGAKPLLFASASGTTQIIGHTGNSSTGNALDGLRVMNLEFRGVNSPLGNSYPSVGVVAGFCGASLDTNWFICNNAFNNLNLGIQTSVQASGDITRGWVIRGNTFTSNYLDAMLGSPGTGGRIDSNLFDNNAGPNMRHTLYLAHGDDYGGNVVDDQNVQIVNNWFQRTNPGGSNGPCSSPIIESHGRFSNLNIENNVIDGGASAMGGCYGISLENNVTGNITAYQNLSVRRNMIMNVGLGIGASQAPGAVIENNVVALYAVSGSWAQGITGQINAARAGTDPIANNITIRNNTIYMPVTNLTNGSSAINIYKEGTGHVIANNAVYSGSSSLPCFSTPLAAGAYTFIGNNACYGGVWGTSYDDASTRVIADPLFTSTQAANAPAGFIPTAASPLVKAGTSAYAPTTDFALESRPNPPSIGAFQPPP